MNNKSFAITCLTSITLAQARTWVDPLAFAGEYEKVSDTSLTSESNGYQSLIVTENG